MIPSHPSPSVQDGLVKANMEKLTFYALSAPEKLDRIGAYLSERLSRDVTRHRYGWAAYKQTTHINKQRTFHSVFNVTRMSKPPVRFSRWFYILTHTQSHFALEKKSVCLLNECNCMKVHGNRCGKSHPMQ